MSHNSLSKKLKIINYELQFIIALINNDHALVANILTTQNIDFSKIVQLANRHRVYPIVFCHLIQT